MFSLTYSPDPQSFSEHVSSSEWVRLEGKISIYFHFYDMFWGILSRIKFLPPVLDNKFSADVIQLRPELHIIAVS